MKTKTLFLSALAVLTLAACHKENDGLMRLTIEGMGNDSKMAVQDGLSYWATGDQVKINGTTLTVSINVNNTDQNATTSVEVSSAAPYYGVYPAGITSSYSAAGYTLDLPANYTYATTVRQGHTYQLLHAPMVGYSEGNTMQFKHVTAAVNVQVVNYYGFTVQVDSIFVSNATYKLCGETTVALDESHDVSVDPVAATIDSTKSIKMRFNGGTNLQVLAGDSAVVQVPVLPVGNSKFTIDVYLHKVDQSDVAAHFSREQANDHSLGRSKMGYARTTFGGLFSVSASKKVVISQGNLQYQASSNTWKFSETQYGSIGNAVGNNNFTDTRSTQSDWIDLFGWGTSGWDGGSVTTSHYFYPYDYLGTGSSGYGYYYGPSTGTAWSPTCTYSLIGDYVNCDWGVYNAINNGGNAAGRWRTMTGGSDAEWEYLMSSRSASTVSGVSNARYLKAKVNGVNGYIVFPDEFTLPDVTITSSHINYNVYLGWGSVTSVLSSSDWIKMETAGAVFLPCTGYRSYSSNNPAFTSDCGYYWSTTYYSASNAYMVTMPAGSPSFTANNAKRLGCFVRLVRDVN